MHALLLAAALVSFDADLTLLKTELPKTHPNPFGVTSRETFEADIERLRDRAPRLQPHEVVVEMARIVAALGDGHTRVSPPISDAYGLFHPHATNPLPPKPELHFRAIPLRFTIAEEGLFTTDGRRVERIGTKTAEEAIAAVAPVVHADNEMQRKDLLAAYLAMVEVLHARGVIASMNEVPVTLAGGETLTLAPTPPPAVRPKLERPWSFTYLEREKAVWFQYDEVSNTDAETLSAFAQRMFAFIDEHPVEKLIIDVRNNYGGNGSLNRAIVHGLIRAKKLQEPGTLFVLIGRRTFSAAMFFASDVEKNTKAIFIGEPTAGMPNSYGDPRKLVLPDSGLLVRISTLYWQSHPRDKRPAIPPHVSAPPSFARDDARAVALDYFGAGAPATNWEGTISLQHDRAPFTIVDGKLSIPGLKIKDVPLEKAPYPIVFRAGSKRMAGTMSANGHEFLVTGTALR